MDTNLDAKSAITIQAPGKLVWQALIDPNLIRQYMFGAHVVSDWKVGTPITWTGEFQGKPYADHGVVLEVRPEEFLSYTHTSASGGSPATTHTVSIWITTDGDHTRVGLTQDNNASEEDRDRSRANWDTMLERLKEIVEVQEEQRRFGDDPPVDRRMSASS